MTGKKQPVLIAVAGKGGTGKTTICGMIVRYLAANGKRVLAVDADPNSNLNEVLGVEIATTLGNIRETMVGREKSGEPVPAGMTKQEYAEFMMGDALTEEDDYDLLVMGRTQGAGCYCYVNGVLKTQIDRYSGAYDYIVVDNEAGLEHISRGTLPHIDLLLLVSDCSRRGIQAVGRVSRMVIDLNLRPGMTGLIVNRAPSGVLDPGIAQEIEREELSLIGVLPQDENVYKYDTSGMPSADVPENSAVKTALRGILSSLEL
ncbi:MAG: AAA family ATPase [Oscillospiraceae bacterium]|jgi:CO dehydrogenase maturation factor|nr:AAA family ATPase [Oscillospiraceae bacterium]